ncbi:MAG: hypothetical protein M3015_04290 [Bacteroidota bacterium]|nr:hypothetical protein [Bacteroidota bacterium]
MTLDVNQLVAEIKDTTSEILHKDITEVGGFSNRQLMGIANQASLIAFGIASGEITEETRDFFLDQIVQLTHNFVRTLVGLLIATIERLWNTIVNIIWGAISKATGFQLPVFTPR